MLKENVMKGCTFLVRMKLMYTFVYSTRILVVYFQFHILIPFCMHLSLLYFDFFFLFMFYYICIFSLENADRDVKVDHDVILY